MKHNSRWPAVRVAVLLALSQLLCSGQVAFSSQAGRVEITIDGEPFSNLYYGPEWTKPFLHPLRSVSGIAVTRGFPLEKIEGETQDHAWHHGLWYSHGDVNGVDFWRDLGPEKTGRMVTQGKLKFARDTVSVETGLVAPDKKILGSIEQTFQFGRIRAGNFVDVHVAIRAGRGSPLKLGDTEEGTFAIRLADEFREDRGAAMTNSNGDSGRAIWGKRAKWVDYSSTIRGQHVGVIVLDHPGNPKHPTYWHARHYGLCSANPFGEHDFEKDKSRDGSITVPAGGRLEFRYRVIIHEERLAGIDPERLFQDFSRSK